MSWRDRAQRPHHRRVVPSARSVLTVGALLIGACTTTADSGGGPSETASAHLASIVASQPSDEWPDRATAHAVLSVFLAHIESGDFDAAAELSFIGEVKDPKKPSTLLTVSDARRAAFIENWCSPGCITNAPPAGGLALSETLGYESLPLSWGIGTGPGRIQAARWKGELGVVGLPPRLDDHTSDAD